ncbi:TRAP transporter small permease [Marinomonas sp. UCMA 3892]|jgi:TRAP-type C4-dicarboxylate transport system permease small subunit|uniref:TRAP transporter small permease protein n=1 Tax=Marinomonas sp. (strain MWYL1) TaxID=400668 RepID=A6VZQ7_MARMS|nr:TRAP transporter small permease [Marinomonas sp. UCMA 3892]NLU97417.1 TRAP transporter small permease [Marinomonas sp. UCMA 3892]
MIRFTTDLKRSSLGRISDILAMTGGVIMLMVAAVTVASIIGRTTIGQSIEGDYEITEMGLAMAIFLFLPTCYIRRGHVIVDLFTANCKQSTLLTLEIISDIVFTIVSFTFAYRMSLSGIEAKEYLEQSMLLELPTWWTFIVGVISMTLCGLCGLYRLFATLRGGSHE